MKDIVAPAKRIALVGLISLIASCSAGNGDGLNENGLPISESAESEEETNPPQSTSGAFTKIQNEILTPECATSGCHNGTTSPLGLNLIDGKAYDKLVGKPSNQVDGLLLVEPSNADSSYLIHKLEGTQDGGAQMPIGKPSLSSEQITLVKKWILDGALEPTDENAEGGEGGAATLSGIQASIFDTQCTSCHSGENPAGTLNLEEGKSFEQLVGRALQFDPDGSILVVANDADQSLLINKLTGEGLGDQQDANYKGQRMPLGGPFLDDLSISKIKDWINSGALNN